MDMVDLSQIPALRPPPCVTPNFVDPPSRAPATYPLSYVFFAVNTIGVMARMYTKVFVIKKVNLEDCMLIHP